MTNTSSQDYIQWAETCCVQARNAMSCCRFTAALGLYKTAYDLCRKAFWCEDVCYFSLSQHFRTIHAERAACERALIIQKLNTLEPRPSARPPAPSKATYLMG